MTTKRLLELTWVGDDGYAYHTANLSPRTARDLIRREIDFRLTIDGEASPLGRLTHAAVSRARRSVRVELNGVSRGQQILVNIPE